MIHVRFSWSRAIRGLALTAVGLVSPATGDVRAAAAAATENLDVLDVWSFYSNAVNAHYRSFMDEALPLLARRKAAVEKLATRADWERYREEARSNIADRHCQDIADCNSNPHVQANNAGADRCCNITR